MVGQSITVVLCAQSSLQSSDAKTLNGGVKHTELEKFAILEKNRCLVVDLRDRFLVITDH